VGCKSFAEKERSTSREGGVVRSRWHSRNQVGGNKGKKFTLRKKEPTNLAGGQIKKPLASYLDAGKKGGKKKAPFFFTAQKGKKKKGGQRFYTSRSGFRHFAKKKKVNPFPQKKKGGTGPTVGAPTIGGAGPNSRPGAGEGKKKALCLPEERKGKIGPSTRRVGRYIEKPAPGGRRKERRKGEAPNSERRERV